MAELSRKFVLLQDRVGATVERSILSLGLSTKEIPTQLLRGELLEALPEAEQPEDSSKIALGGIERKSLKLECALDCIMRLTEEDANLLLAISSPEERYQTYMDRGRLEFGEKIIQGSRVFVNVKGISKKLPGVVWYKGGLPGVACNGTMFGVELTENPGQGTSDGTFRNYRYFTCPPDSGVFVGLDKLTPRDESDSKYQRKGESVNIASRITEIVRPSFMKRKNKPGLSDDGMDNLRKVGERVVTFLDGDHIVRGTVRYIGKDKDRNGKIQTVLGLELDTMDGNGIGRLHNRQLFVCRRNYALFTSMHAVIPEKDFDANPSQAKSRGIPEDKSKAQEQIRRDEEYAKSLGYVPSSAGDNAVQTAVDNPYAFELGTMVDVPMAGVPRYGVIRWIGHLPQVKDKLVAGLELEDEQSACSDGTCNGERYFTCPPGRGFFTLLIHCRPDARFTSKSIGSDNSFHSGKEILPSHSGDSQQALHSLQERLREKEERANLMRQLRRTEEQEDRLQRELVRQEQELEDCQEQLRDKDEQLREKEQEQENSQRQLSEMEQRLTTCQEQLQEREAGLLEQLREKEQEQESSQRQLSEMEQRLTYYQEQKQEREAGLLEQLREKEQQQESSQRQLSDMEQRLTNCQEQLEEREAGLLEQLRQKEQQQENSQRQLTEMEQRLANLERRLGVKDQELNELETSLSAAQQTISNQVRRQETCDWVIARDEIQIKEKCLGRGGWGSVNEGTYCCCVVAVKQIHELILSPHNRRLFEREMNIASRCRHPCLLQFIGATNDEGSPLFVTELMETSLRALLEQRELSETEICVISLDVARALNYLHQRRPSPILHRDVSSANVLLWRQSDQWRGKVSDYGTAKFVQQTMTVAPGALIYSSPEALSSNQTAMVDVYSFGVLLCEMCIREMPDPEKRDEQVLLVTNRVLRGLVRRCLQTDPAMRPDMAQIIQELEQFNETRS